MQRSHTDELGLDRNLVQEEILKHLSTIQNQIQDGKPFNSIIQVQGISIQYTVFKLLDGTLNIGRIHGTETTRSPKK